MTNFSDAPNPADIESPMFAPIPAWERNKKRRSFGRSAAPAASTIAAEERSYAPVDPVTPRLDPMPGETETETVFAGTPTYASRTTVRRNNTAPLAIAAGVVLIGGLAAAGWYATQPHGAGVAELTPGQATTTTTTTAPADAGPAPGQLAVQDTLPPVAPAAPAKAATPTTTTTTTTHRAPAPRPVSRSVEASGVNASTVAAAPAPAPAAAPAPAPAPLVLTPAPTQSAAPDTAAVSPPAPAPTPTPPAPAPTETPPTT